MVRAWAVRSSLQKQKITKPRDSILGIHELRITIHQSRRSLEHRFSRIGRRGAGHCGLIDLLAQFLSQRLHVGIYENAAWIGGQAR